MQEKIQQPLLLEGSAEKLEAKGKPSPADGTLESQGEGIKGARNSWSWMKARCLHPCTNGYENYGGRGIKICDRWRKFENFLTDMGPRPKDHWIERKDPNGNYEPSNCVWLHKSLSSRNRRATPIPFVEGESKLDRTRKIYRLWIKNNKARRAATDLAWRDRNRDKLRAGYKQFRKLRPELREASRKKYYEKHKSKIRENHKRWYLANRETLLAKDKIRRDSLDKAVVKAKRHESYLKNREKIIEKEREKYWARKGMEVPK